MGLKKSLKHWTRFIFVEREDVVIIITITITTITT